jgi:hypothetical protein
MCTLSITALTMMPVEAIPDDSKYHHQEQQQDVETSAATTTITGCCNSNSTNVSFVTSSTDATSNKKTKS